MAREEAHQMKMLISYGGSFKEATAWEKEQREKVRYAGGESKIISVDRGGIDLRSLLARISELIPGALLSVPADPPGLWLSHLLVWAAAGPDDAGGQILVPVLEDGDVARMTAEHDRLAALGRPARLRVFLCDSAPSPAWRLGEADVPATTMTNAFLGEGGYFSGLLSDDGLNVWKTGRAGEKKVRAGGPHLVGQAENKEPRGRTAGASRRCAPRPPPLPQPIKPVQARRKAASRAGNAAEWPGLVVKKGETQIPMHARKPAFLPTQQVLLKSEGIQALSTCFMQLLQREIDSRSSLTKHGRRTAALGGAYRLHTPLACSDSDALPPLDWTVERWTERTEEGRSRGEAVAQKADAKVQSESIEARGKLQPAFPQLATGQLQTIRSRDLEEIRELGSGSFGTVFHGKWKGSDVAIKRLKPSCFAGGGSVSDRLIAEFWKEAHLLAQLHHPNLVAFYGVVTDGRRTSLATVTEFMVNGSLKQVLGRKDRTIDRRKRLIIAMDAAFGMEYLHEKGVVHFDLKSHNFLVNMRDSHRPVCKIGDLGLSKVKRRTLVSGGVRGTIPWMAPELLNSHTNMVTEKVDVYSFGIVMWELLTGEEPYEYMSSEEVIAGIIRGDLRPEIPSWCEPNWRSLMERCWAGEPSSRPPFSAIAKELRAMAAGMNIL